MNTFMFQSVGVGHPFSQKVTLFFEYFFFRQGERDPRSCRNVRCGQNADCEAGKCVCIPGFSGDPDKGCFKESKRMLPIKLVVVVC